MIKGFGILVCGASVLCAVAIWLFLLVTGIVGLAEALTTQPIDGSSVGWSVVKIVLAETAGGIVGFVGVLFGSVLIVFSERYRK